MDKRLKALTHWVRQCYPNKSIDIKPLAGDASFRRYFRVSVDDTSIVAMDAPPLKEELHPFIAVAKAIAAAGLPCPEILFEELSQGFLLLSDCGDDLLLSVVNNDNADELYRVAIDQIITFQTIESIPGYQVPLFDEAYQRGEMALFQQWFLGEYLHISLSSIQQQQLEQAFNTIIKQTTSQPQTLIHRDYHSRNLLLCPQYNSGPDTLLSIIDFQDAMIGPYSYDLLSLIKDCYIEWPQDQRDSWIEYFQQHCQFKVTVKQLQRDSDFCGIQRHLKVLGIFSRLYLRDNKPGFLADIPLTLKYLQQAAEKYSELSDLTDLLQSITLPDKN